MMMSILRYAAAALPLLLTLPATSWAQTSMPFHMQQGQAAMPADGVMVHDAWARAGAGTTGAGAAFMTLEAPAGTADRLLSASTPAARKVELHETKMEGNIMRMLPVAGIDMVPGVPVELKPGGYHIMLMDMPTPLKAGDSIPLTLTFAHAQPVTMTLKVVAPGGGMPAHSH